MYEDDNEEDFTVPQIEEFTADDQKYHGPGSIEGETACADWSIGNRVRKVFGSKGYDGSVVNATGDGIYYFKIMYEEDGEEEDFNVTQMQEHTMFYQSITDHYPKVEMPRPRRRLSCQQNSAAAAAAAAAEKRRRKRSILNLKEKWYGRKQNTTIIQQKLFQAVQKRETAKSGFVSSGFLIAPETTGPQDSSKTLSNPYAIGPTTLGVAS